MASRTPNEARVYLRRSTGKQESSMYAQLEWAVAEAPRHGVRLDATRADLEHMLPTTSAITRTYTSTTASPAPT